MNDYQFQKDLIERDHGLRYQDKVSPTTAHRDYANKEWLKPQPNEPINFDKLDRLMVIVTGGVSLAMVVVWFFL